MTAFRIVGEKAGPAEAGPGAATRKDAPPLRPEGRGANRMGTKPVRMSFRTDRPSFPYREPVDQRDDRAKLIPRSLRVFFIGGKRYAGQLGDGAAAWPGRTVWSDKLSGSVQAEVLSKAKLPAGAGSREWWLTEFEDHATPRPGTDEVYFSPSAHQSPVARPPAVIWTEDWAPWYVGLAVAFGLPALFVAGLLVRRLARRG